MYAAPAWLRPAALMMTLALCAFSAPAVAQPAPPPGASAAAQARLVWAIGPVVGARWPGSAAISLNAEAGARLEVVAEDNELLRVRLGTTFGWVPKASVQDTEPKAIAAPLGAPTITEPAGD